MLDWDEIDVLSVLEVIPEVEEYSTYHLYVVEKDGLRLSVTIHQYDGDIKFELINLLNGQQIFLMRLIGCECLRRRKDDTGEYLEFASSKCFGSRYDEVRTVDYGVRVSVHSGIKVVLF
ncbi:Ypar14, super integron cassette [Vibrio sp. S4M6]|uniref:Ypar14, super integron cassette n=1 Tax=Vibrio sinus TaxID=2946865 RepID=UPI002029F1ED|nr:Ypar14, super integron cassette [Vibrio sinus]MCL9782110.1 Ypar14, super integron cassette [Vibrio sinus]